MLRPLSTLQNCQKHTYTRPRAAAVTSLLYSICSFGFVVTIVIVQMCLAFKKSIQERSFDIGISLKSVSLVQSSLDCKANVEQLSHQCFERSVQICEPLDIRDYHMTFSILAIVSSRDSHIKPDSGVAGGLILVEG